MVFFNRYRSGVDPGFDEGGWDKRPPKAVAPSGVRGHVSPENFHSFTLSSSSFALFLVSCNKRFTRCLTFA